jgi:hypothetical protein
VLTSGHDEVGARNFVDSLGAGLLVLHPFGFKEGLLVSLDIVDNICNLGFEGERVSHVECLLQVRGVRPHRDAILLRHHYLGLRGLALVLT